MDTLFYLAERLIGFNKAHRSLGPLRILAASALKGCTLEEGLLLYQGRLIVPDVDNVRTELVKEAYK